jgi:hypothetical protein
MPDDQSRPFSNLDSAEFMVLTTVRQTGEPVPTTVWFAVDGDTLYVTTQITAGKLKRVQADPHVTMAPSDSRGHIRGPEAHGLARVLPPDEHFPARATLAAKYRDQWTAATADPARDATRTFLAIRSANA